MRCIYSRPPQFLFSSSPFFPVPLPFLPLRQLYLPYLDQAWARFLLFSLQLLFLYLHSLFSFASSCSDLSFSSTFSFIFAFFGLTFIVILSSSSIGTM